MRFQVLGPLRAVQDGDELPLGGEKQRSVLALLLADFGRVVSAERLIDGVWGDAPPATARKGLQGYIHHLRTQLGDALVTEGRGYLITTEHELDAVHFTEQVAAASELLEHDPAAAAQAFREALTLWRGAAYADLRGLASLAPEIARLESLRLTALQQRLDADLALGRHAAVVGEVEGLAAEHPLDERVRRQHMLALYRCGRQVEALRSYESLRRQLVEELGLEPSRETRELEQRILNQDPALDIAAEDGPGVEAIRGYELRDLQEQDGARSRYLAYQRSVGRQVAVSVFSAEIADDPAFVGSFLQDAKRLAELDHPRVSPLLDAWREPGRAVEVTRWLAGGTLAQRLADGPLSPTRAMRVVEAIGGALDAAHRSGVTHGAVSAEAVRFDEEDHAYLDSFRIGRARGSVADDVAAFAELTAAVLGDAAATVAADRPAKVADIVRAVQQATGAHGVAPPGDAPFRTPRRNPYKGLHAFDETDAADFFGREMLVDRLQQTAARQQLVAIVGPSGSGKSSLVRAGLVPRLREQGSPAAPVLVSEMYPGAYPFEELETALRRVGVADGSMVADLTADQRGLMRVVKRILPGDHAMLVLVVDQFEELFSMVADEQVRRLFLDSLRVAVSDPRSRLRVVLTMRADFYDRPLQYPGFGALVEDGLVSVTMPDEASLAAAISQPAAAVGVTFEDGLITQIVSDVADQPGGLPLLQYAVTELFQQRDADVLTHRAYHASGGVQGALGRRAEVLYTELGPRAQQATQQTFLRLVAIDAGGGRVRTRVRRAELSRRGGGDTGVDEQVLDEALTAFGRLRLLTFDHDPISREPTVEVAHEALLSAWPRLSEWIEVHRDDLLTRRRLAAAVEEWRQAAEDPGFLVGGGRLARFEDWTRESTLALNADEHRFLEESTTRERRRAEAAARRRRAVVAGLSVLSLVLASLAGFAFLQRRQARASAVEAETARLVATAQELAFTNPRAAMLLAVAAFQRAETPATLGALQATMIRSAPQLATLGFGTAYSDVEWTSDGLIVGIRTDGLDLFDPRTSQLRASEDLAVGDGSYQLLGAQLGRDWLAAAATEVPTIAVISSEPAVTLFEVVDSALTRRATFPLEQHPYSVAIAPDASWVAAGTGEGGIRIWDAEGRVIADRVLQEHPDIRAQAVPTLGEDFPFAPLFGTPPAVYVAPGPDDTITASVGTILHTLDTSGDAIRPPALVTRGVPGSSVPSTGMRLHQVEGGVVVTGGGVGIAPADALASGAVLTNLLEGVVGGGSTASVQASRFVAGRYLTLLSNGSLVYFDPADGSQVDDVDVGLSEAQSLSIDASGRVAVIAHPEGLTVVSLLGGSPISAAIPRTDGQTTATISRDGRYVAVSPSGQPLPEGVQLYAGVEDPQPVPDVGLDSAFIGTLPPAAHHDALEIGALLPDNRTRWVRYDVGGARPTLVDQAIDISFSSISPDGDLVAQTNFAFDGGDGVGWVEILDRGTLEVLRMLDFPPGSPPRIELSQLTFTPSGDVLLATHHGRAQLIDVATGDPLLDDELAETDIVLANWNADASIVATAATDGRITLRDGDTFAELRTFVGAIGQDNVRQGGLLFSDDDSLLLTNFAGPGRLWDVATGEQIGIPFPTIEASNTGGNYGEVLQLATVGERAALVWDLDVGGWAARACAAAGSALSQAEWDQWGPRDEPLRDVCADVDPI